MVCFDIGGIGNVVGVEIFGVIVIVFSMNMSFIKMIDLIIIFMGMYCKNFWCSLMKLMFSIIMIKRKSMVMVLIYIMIKIMVRNLVFRRMNSLVVLKNVRIKNRIEWIGFCEEIIKNVVLIMMVENR